MLDEIQPAATRTSLKTWHDSLKTRALKILTEEMPAQILRLNEAISKMTNETSHELHLSHLKAISELPLVDSAGPAAGEDDGAPSAKKRKREASAVNGSETTTSSYAVKFTETTNVPAPLLAALELVRLECEKLVDLIDPVKLYITLQLPKAEDGNNSGVQTAEDCVSEVARAQDLGLTLLDCTYKYTLGRAKLCSKLLKYPNSGEYKLGIRELDRNQFMLCRQRLTDMRNLYAGLVDVCLKNLSKVKEPRSEFSRDMF